MSSRAKENSHGGDKRAETQQGGSASLWSNQDEMRRYVSKLKSDLEEQKSRVKRVHRDKAEEIKRLQESLDSEKQRAIENVSKKLESDKAYELKKMKESVAKQKELELRQVVRMKDDELRTLKQELQESRNASRILESENKRITSEPSRGEQNEHERRLKNELASLRNDKRRLEESLRIKSDADFEKAELIRKMKQEHDAEIRKLTRESKRESLKEFRQLKAVSREVELKNHQLAAKEAEMKRLELEKNHLGNELNSQRRGSLKKNNSFNSQKVKGLSTSQTSEPDFDNVAEERIKKLKMRNSELVAIARKLEEKARQLQEEKDLLEKSNEMKNPEMGSLKRAFARQRAKDLTERAKLLLNKDNEINNLRKQVDETRHNGFSENDSVDELEKMVHQNSKERLLMEKQLSLKVESLLEEIKEITAQNTSLSKDNDILKQQVSKLQDFESKHNKTLSEMNVIRKRNETLENACSEKDKRLYNSELEKQAFTAKNNALQKRNNELLSKVDQLNQVQQQCLALKENVLTLTEENRLVKDQNTELREEIESLSGVKKEVERLMQENTNLEKERKNAMLKLEERDEEISSLHQAQEHAQREYSEDVSGLEDMVRRLQEQQAQKQNQPTEIEESTSASSVLTSTPKDSKFTQTSRPSSPVMSPITLSEMKNLQGNGKEDTEDKSSDSEVLERDLLAVPYNGTSSSTSFDLEKAGTRIQQLAASDSDEVDANHVKTRKQHSSLSSDVSEYSAEASDDNTSDAERSYSADVSRTSDVEELCDTTLQDDAEEPEDEHEDLRDHPDIYIGSPLQHLPDLEDKLSIFIAKYNYDPMLYSPNENPETELAFQAGDYLYVYGDVDGDGFYVGELMNGERGLVPSNFVERIAEEEAILKESDDVDEEDVSEERRHEMFRSSLDHVLTDQLDDIRESEEDDLGASSLSEDELHENRKNWKNRNTKPEADQVFSEGFDSMDSDVPAPRVPSPTKLSLDRQFTNSALISWRGATLPSEEIQGYNIYVDGKFKTLVKGSKKTNAVVEDIKPTETYRLSVRTKSVSGLESHDHEATMVFGPDAKLAPENLRVTKITATSCEIQWLPAHSSYEHEILMNDETVVECIQPGCSGYTMNELSPGTLYQIQVRTRILDQLKLTAGKIHGHCLSAELEFTTAEGGLPEPPVDLRLAQRTSETIMLTWLPVTLSQDGYSNGYKVCGYKVYVNGIYCTETTSACVDSASITMERLNSFGRRHDFSRMRFVVRTLSVLGESVDSNAVDIESDKSGATITGVGFRSEKDGSIPFHDAKQTVVVGNFASNCSEPRLNSHSELSENGVDPNPSYEEAIQSERCSNTVTDKGQESKDVISETTSLHSEHDRESAGTEETELDSEGKNENGELVEHKNATEDQSAHPEVPTTIVRRPPIVTRYEETETESESTESKTLDTEEELIERFTHLEISEKEEFNKGNAGTNEKEGSENKSTFGDEQVLESGEAKEIIDKQDDSKELDSKRNDLESFQEQTEDSGNENKVSLQLDICEPPKSNDENETCNVVENKTDSGPESGTPQNPNSLSSEQQSESETESEEGKHFQKLIQNVVSTDVGSDVVRLPPLSGGPLQSDSETETEYGPPLSVIDEVDEDNLTTTRKSTENATSDSEATLSNKELKSLPTDSSKSSDLPGTRSRTITSDDDGFRTEDDVLDLLEDDEGLGGKPLGEKGGDQSASRVNKGITDRTSGDNSNVSERINREDVGNIGVTIDDDRDLGVPNVTQDRITTKLSESLPDSDSDRDTLSCNITESGEANTNGHTTGEESTEDLTDSTCPTRTSLKSDSSSISEAPPGADHALATIMNTLSFPSNRGMASGESDHNGNIVSGLERTSEVISEENRTGSEMSEHFAEQVRYFIALYSYDPLQQSPNADGADEELPFIEGDIIKVYGDQDEDGFYWGECKCKQGLVPSNMVSEVDINEAEDLFNEASDDVRLHNELNDQSREQVNGELDVDVISGNLSPSSEGTGAGDRLSFWENLENGDLTTRKMKALYDYDPARDSPNVDSEIELKFRSGEIIYVFGEMDDDGFFKGELNGIRGLVPSNFMQPMEDFNAEKNHLSNGDSQAADLNANFSSEERQSNAFPSNDAQQSTTEEAELPVKKKKNIFSKGRKIFKKAFK